MVAANTIPTVPTRAFPAGVVDEGDQRLGRYTIVGVIGRGGMGIVYRARDPVLERDLAIKVVRAPSGSTAQVRLIHEARAMALLRRPGVMPVFDVGAVSEGVFIVMPYFARGTLGGWLREARRPWRDVLDRFVSAGRGLAAAHAAGLVHRDFKPENVLVDDDGEALVADFGLARPVRDDLAARDEARPFGTLAYMSPEQLRGEPTDERADVFSFCVSLYRGLFHQRPFEIDDTEDPVAAQLDAIVSRDPRESPPERGVPRWLYRAVVRGLAPDPAARWPSMDVLLAHLARRRRRVRWPTAIAATASAAITVLATVLPVRAPAAAITSGSHRDARLTSCGEVRAPIAGDVDRAGAEHPEAPEGTCAIRGAYRWLDVVAPRSDHSRSPRDGSPLM